MKKNMKKIGFIVLIMFALLFLSSSNIYASALDTYKNAVNTTSGNAEIKSIMSAVLKIVQTVGSVIAVLVLVAIGIKYMIGSVEEKAEYKRKLVPYIVGALILFAGTTIPAQIYKLVVDVNA